MTLERALVADRSGRLVEAAEHYERILNEEKPSLEVMLNLALLYWQATDPGLAAELRLGRDFLCVAGRRTLEILEDALRRFPNSVEVRFWKRYIAWADLGESFGADECRRLWKEDPDLLVPAMHLYALSNGDEAEREAMILLQLCKANKVGGARYIISVVEAVARRRSEKTH